MSVLFFVGPLPKPLHGFSLINSKMLDAFSGKSDNLFVYDLTPRFYLSWLCRFFGFLFRALQQSVSGQRKVMYLGLSGGLRQGIDLMFLFVARILNFDIYIHHHSFAYLNNPSRVNNLALNFSKGMNHIVLCGCMREKLVEMYSVDERRITVLSNSAFLGDDWIKGRTFNDFDSEFIRLGFLSNITEAKGIFLFFDLLDALSEIGFRFHAFIAGPVDDAISIRFKNRLDQIPSAKYMGPLYDKEKIDFFENLDFFVFPTMYANEAEPVTLWEATASGLNIIAISRGCISDIVHSDVGLVVDAPEDFIEKSLKHVVEKSLCIDDLRSRRGEVVEKFITARSGALREIKALFQKMFR